MLFSKLIKCMQSLFLLLPQFVNFCFAFRLVLLECIYLLTLLLQVTVESIDCIGLSRGRLLLALDHVLAVSKITFQFSAVVWFGSKVCLKFLLFFFWFFKIVHETRDLWVKFFDVMSAGLNFSLEMSAFVMTWLEIAFKLGILVLKFLYFTFKFFFRIC